MSQTYTPRRAAHAERLSVRGIEHRVLRWGEPSATPVVLLHGFMDSALTWQFLIDCLPDSWACVAPDWRGFGESGRAADGYWFPDYLADLDALLDALVPQARARVIGHSMGGNIASMYAGIRTARLAWLVNLEGVGLPRTSAELAPQRYAQWLEEVAGAPARRHYDSIEQLVRILRARNARLSEARARFIAAAWTRPTAAGCELAADPAHSRVNPVLYRREEAEACWKRIAIPMLLVLGELSDHVARLGQDGTEEYRRGVFATARTVTLSGVGHMMHHEDPQGVARHIAQFAADLA